MTPSHPPDDEADHLSGDDLGSDPGMVRAGAAAAARRRELDISQRSLAHEKIISAGALIAFEKGRSWPRKSTRDRLDQVLQWPPGTIDRLRRGASDTAAASATTPRPEADTADGGALIAQAIDTGIALVVASAAELPPVEHPTFAEQVTNILANLRQFESVATKAARVGPLTPPLLRTLSAVRRHIDELTLRAASGPRATPGQLLYAARRRASITQVELAGLIGITPDEVARTEADGDVHPDTAERIRAFVLQIDWA